MTIERGIPTREQPVLARLVLHGHAFLQRHSGVKSWIKAALRRTGLLRRAAIYAGSIAVDSGRAPVAGRFLRGTGLEIGAMHLPLPVPPDVRVTYVDRLSKAEAMRRYPEIDDRRMVTPDIVADGFSLQTIAAGSQDFVIANHVLEHSPNPIQALVNWARVVRPGGVVFVTVPIGSACFDRGRPETSINHIVEDYRLVASEQLTEFAERNVAHYREWVAISVPNAARDEGRVPNEMSLSNVTREAAALAAAREEIHFHVFSVASFQQLLETTAREVPLAIRIEELRANGGEVIAVLRIIAETL